MSATLTDCRCKITGLTDAVVEALHRDSGRDRSEIIRDVLHEWALREVSKARLVADLAAREGSAGAYEGIGGIRGDSEGARGK